MDGIELLRGAWPGAGETLFRVGEVEVAKGALVVLPAALLLAAVAVRLGLFLADRRLAGRPAARRAARAAVLVVGTLLGVAVALDLAQLATVGAVLAAAGRAMHAELLDVGGVSVTASSLLAAGVVVALTFYASALLQRLVVRALEHTGLGARPGGAETAARLVHVAVLAAGGIVALQAVGLDLSSMLAAGAVFAVGIGFALQDIARNFVSGIILLVERSIRPGDVLEVDGRLVRVLRPGIRATVVRDIDDKSVILPNTLLAQEAVRNLSLDDPATRVRARVGVRYDADMRAVRAALEEAARRFEGRVADREPVVLLVEFADSAVVWEVSVWSPDPWRLPRAAAALREALWWALADAGIEMAFPQLDLHLDPPVEESLRLLAGAR